MTTPNTPPTSANDNMRMVGECPKCGAPAAQQYGRREAACSNGHYWPTSEKRPDDSFEFLGAMSGALVNGHISKAEYDEAVRLCQTRAALYEALEALADEFESRYLMRQPTPRHVGKDALDNARAALRQARGE